MPTQNATNPYQSTPIIRSIHGGKSRLSSQKIPATIARPDAAPIAIFQREGSFMAFHTLTAQLKCVPKYLSLVKVINNARGDSSSKVQVDIPNTDCMQRVLPSI